MTRVVQSSAHTAGRDSGDGSAVGGQQRALPRDRLTVMCLTLAVAVLLPGVLAAVAEPLAPGTMLGQWHQDMIVALRDIRFGSGVRFWLGVAGALAMALLLVYPLRKAVPLRFRIGRVASWFRLHIVIGVFAPVSILYHANFGFGGFNANVALVAMLAIAVSGLVGQFVYHPSNAGFHGGVAEIEARGVAVADGLRQIDGMFAAKSALADRMAAFSAPVPTPGVRFGAMLRHGLGARRQSRCLEADALWILAQSRAGQPARGSDVALAGTLAVGMRAYGDAVRAAALASVRVRVWLRWRLFHLPLFVIMTVAAGLHVAAVWGVDDGHGPAALEDGVPATSPSPPPPSVLPGLVAPAPEAPTVRGPEVSAAPDRGERQNAVRTGRLAWLLPPSDFAGFAPTVRPSAVAEASTSAVETLAQVARSRLCRPCPTCRTSR